MEIHEITKRQRTDEGLLDGLKGAIKQKATSVYNNTKQSAQDKVSSIKNIPGQIKQDYASGVKASTDAGPQNPLLSKLAGAGNVFTGAANRSQEKQWDTRQDKINKQAADAAKKLAGKGFNVDTTTKAAQAQTPTRVKQQQQQQQQQKIGQLQQAFDQEFDVGYELVPGAAEKYAQQKAAAQQKPPVSKLQQTIAAQNKQMSPQSGIKEAQVNPNKLATMKARARAPGAAPQPVKSTTKKDIATDFITWINQQIPGLQNVAPEVKAQLNGIFAKMKTLKGNPKAVDAAFQQYADLALSSVVKDTPQPQQGQQLQGKPSPSAQYAQQAIAGQLGISPDAISKLQQRMSQNKEQISNPSTGSKTMDTLIQAVTKK